MNASRPPTGTEPRLGFRGRLLVVSLVLMGIYAVVSAIFVTTIAQPEAKQRMHVELGHLARLAAPMVTAGAGAARVADGLDARVVVVSADGSIRDDSQPQSPLSADFVAELADGSAHAIAVSGRREKSSAFRDGMHTATWT